MHAKLPFQRQAEGAGMVINALDLSRYTENQVERTVHFTLHTTHKKDLACVVSGTCTGFDLS